MQFSTVTILSVAGAFADLASAACNHNNDAGRWSDVHSPVGVIARLCAKSGGGCTRAQGGALLCVSGDTSKCVDAIESAADWTSQHGDWFLWSAISCDGLSITMA